MKVATTRYGRVPEEAPATRTAFDAAAPHNALALACLSIGRITCKTHS